MGTKQFPSSQELRLPQRSVRVLDLGKKLKTSTFVSPLLILILESAISFLPFTNSKPSYASQKGQLFNLSQADINDAHASDAFNLGNPQTRSNSTTLVMSSGQPPNPEQWSIITETFAVNLPYGLDTQLTFAGSSGTIDFTREAVRVFIRMLNGTNVFQQSYIIGRPEDKMLMVNTYLYYSIALPNSTNFSVTRNVTSDLRSEGLSPSRDWTIVWVGFGFIRYAPVSNSLFVMSVDRNSVELASGQIDPIRFSTNYTSEVFLPVITIGALAAVGFTLSLWSDLKRNIETKQRETCRAKVPSDLAP